MEPSLKGEEVSEAEPSEGDNGPTGPKASVALRAREAILRAAASRAFTSCWAMVERRNPTKETAFKECAQKKRSVCASCLRSRSRTSSGRMGPVTEGGSRFGGDPGVVRGEANLAVSAPPQYVSAVGGGGLNPARATSASGARATAEERTTEPSGATDREKVSLRIGKACNAGRGPPVPLMGHTTAGGVAPVLAFVGGAEVSFVGGRGAEEEEEGDVLALRRVGDVT